MVIDEKYFYVTKYHLTKNRLSTAQAITPSFLNHFIVSARVSLNGLVIKFNTLRAFQMKTESLSSRCAMIVESNWSSFLSL